MPRASDCGRNVGEANFHRAVFARTDVTAHANDLSGGTINDGETKPIGGRSDCLQDRIKMFPKHAMRVDVPNLRVLGAGGT